MVSHPHLIEISSSFRGEQLSLGEQQRLSLCRVFFHRPSIVFLDESTSSLSESAEKTVYTLLDTVCEIFIESDIKSTSRPKSVTFRRDIDLL